MLLMLDISTAMRAASLRCFCHAYDAGVFGGGRPNPALCCAYSSGRWGRKLGTKKPGLLWEAHAGIVFMILARAVECDNFSNACLRLGRSSNPY